MPIIIRPLADVPTALPLIARWIHDEWHDIDGRSIESVQQQLSENLNRDRVPITFLAEVDAQIVGTASLDASDLPAFDFLTPWLASLYVLPEARRRGIASALVRHTQAFATTHGIDTMYLWTAGPSGFYRQMGWVVVQRSTYGSRPITLMRYGI